MNYASHAWFPPPTSLGETPLATLTPERDKRSGRAALFHLDTFNPRSATSPAAITIDITRELSNNGARSRGEGNHARGRGHFFLFLSPFLLSLSLFFSFLFSFSFFFIHVFTYSTVFDGKFSIYIGGAERQAEQHLHPNGNNALETVSGAPERRNSLNNRTLQCGAV